MKNCGKYENNLNLIGPILKIIIKITFDGRKYTGNSSLSN